MPGHVHQVVLHLVQGDQQPEQQTRALTQTLLELEPAGGPDAQCHGDPALGDVVPDPVQVDPSGDDVCRQRATSPSQQSSSICSWTNTTARIAPARVDQAVATAASTAHAIISQVTPLAEKPALSRIRVRYGRDVAQVGARDPVLRAGPGPHARRLGDRPAAGRSWDGPDARSLASPQLRSPDPPRSRTPASGGSSGDRVERQRAR